MADPAFFMHISFNPKIISNELKLDAAIHHAINLIWESQKHAGTKKTRWEEQRKKFQTGEITIALDGFPGQTQESP